MQVATTASTNNTRTQVTDWKDDLVSLTLESVKEFKLFDPYTENYEEYMEERYDYISDEYIKELQASCVEKQEKRERRYADEMLNKQLARLDGSWRRW